MKLKVNWSELWKQLWEAVKPVLLGAVGGGLVCVSAGCSSLTTTPRGQTTEIVAVGVPAVAWITHTSQDAEHSGSDTYGISTSNATQVSTSVTADK